MSKRIVVSLSRNTVTAYTGDTVYHLCDCVTARAGNASTPGSFSVYRKDPEQTSKNSNASAMTHALFFDTTGDAIHAAPESAKRDAGRNVRVEALGTHGSVGVAEKDARKLFSWAPISTPVVVEG